jgi:hypothetical protein
VPERLERLIIRLIDPAGGATLGNLNTTSVWLSDPGTTAAIGFLDAEVTVQERGFAKAVAVVQRTGTAVGAVSVDIDTLGDADGTDIAGDIPLTLSWEDGDAAPKNIELDIVDDGIVESTESITLTLANPSGAVAGNNDSFRVFIQDAGGSNVAPNAIAGASQSRPSGSTVTLDGSMSGDPNGDSLSYSWLQTGGPAVTLRDASAAVANFAAPTVSSDMLLRFQLTVVDSGGLSDAATTTVTVTRAPEPPASSGGGGGGALSLLALLLMASLSIRERLSRKGRS